MKKVRNLLIFILFLIFPSIVHAATISTYSSGNVIAGNTINVSVSLSEGASWEMILDYDSSMLQFVGGGGEAGGMKMVNTSTGNPGRSYNFTFRALKSGNTTVKVSSYDIYDNGGNNITSNTASYGTNIRIMTQAELEASYSKNNNLGNLAVEGAELSPKFDKDTLEYKVEVSEDVKEVNIVATPEDRSASVSGAGSQKVTAGTNTFKVVVTAENGSQKTYKLVVEVLDKNPIKVKINGQNYTVVKVKDLLKKPSSFKEKTIKINKIKVPAFYNKKLNYTLVGLKNKNGKVGLYIYKNNKYTKYFEINSGNITIYPLEMAKKLKGYKKYNIKINGNKVECLSLNKNSRIKIIYGVDVNTGKKNLYMYDTNDESIMMYDKEIVNMYEEKIKLLTYSTGAFLLTSIIAFISIICVAKKKSKKNPKKETSIIDEVSKEIEETKIEEKPKKNKTSKVKEEPKEDKLKEEEPKVKEIVTEETEEFYDIFEDEHKKKKKSKK